MLVLLSRRRQRLGDLAAGTIVIRERTAAAPDYEHLIGRLATQEDAFTPNELAACTAGDRQVLRAFFHRYEQMEPGARQELATRLAILFIGKTGHRPSEAVAYGASVPSAIWPRCTATWRAGCVTAVSKT